MKVYVHFDEAEPNHTMKVEDGSTTVAEALQVCSSAHKLPPVLNFVVQRFCDEYNGLGGPSMRVSALQLCKES